MSRPFSFLFLQGEKREGPKNEEGIRRLSSKALDKVQTYWSSISCNIMDHFGLGAWTCKFASAASAVRPLQHVESTMWVRNEQINKCIPNIQIYEYSKSNP